MKVTNYRFQHLRNTKSYLFFVIIIIFATYSSHFSLSDPQTSFASYVDFDKNYKRMHVFWP